jgi:simple sugar transport system permease protein
MSLPKISPRALRLWALTVGIFLLFSVARPHTFPTVLNFQLMAFSLPEAVLFTLAVTITMLTGGIDLSIVSVSNAAALVAVSVMTAMGRNNTGIIVGMVAGLVAAMACGMVNGFLVSKARITPILATLATMQLLNGVSVALTNGKPLTNLPATFISFGTGKFLGLPLPLILMVIVSAAIGFIIRRTRVGVELHLLGDNPIAARYSGLRSDWLLVLAYTCSGLLAGIAGLLIASRTASASADFGKSYVLGSIVIAVLAGVRTEGGRATVGGVLLAGVCLQALTSGLNSMNASPFVYLILQGVVLLVVMGLDNLRPRQRRVLPPSTDATVEEAAANLVV